MLLLFLDVDGVLNYRPVTEKVNKEPYRYDKSDLFLANLEVIYNRYQPIVVMSSTWRFNRTVGQINDALMRKIGLRTDKFRIHAKLRDRREGENWTVREHLILEYLEREKSHYQGWLTIDDLPMKLISDSHQVRPEVGEGFGSKRLGEALVKIEAQKGKGNG